MHQLLVDEITLNVYVQSPLPSGGEGFVFRRVLVPRDLVATVMATEDPLPPLVYWVAQYDDWEDG